jgi:hypothetical protein
VAVLKAAIGIEVLPYDVADGCAALKDRMK